MNHPRCLMKPIHFLIHPRAVAAASLLCLALTASAADKPAAPATKPAKAAPAATNSASAEVEIPKSVFTIPTSPAEGKDPFFPKSTRLFNTVVIAASPTNKQPAAIKVDLQLKGISGFADHRYAIIGTRTFEVGEEHEFATSSGRVRIRCLEITSDSVTVQVGGEQRILHLRTGI